METLRVSIDTLQMTVKAVVTLFADSMATKKAEYSSQVRKLRDNCNVVIRQCVQVMFLSAMNQMCVTQINVE